MRFVMDPSSFPLDNLKNPVSFNSQSIASHQLPSALSYSAKKEKILQASEPVFKILKDLGELKQNYEKLREKFHATQKMISDKNQEINDLKKTPLFNKLGKLFQSKDPLKITQDNLVNLEKEARNLGREGKKIDEKIRELDQLDKATQFLNNFEIILKDYSFNEADDIGAILRIESDFRFILENKNTPPSFLSPFQEFYSNRILPLTEEAKTFLRKRPAARAAAAAASGGQAALAAISAIANFSTEFVGLQSNTGSVQMVDVKPKMGVVFKENKLRAKEESGLVSNLLALMTKGGVLGSFNSTTLSLLSQNENEQLKNRYELVEKLTNENKPDSVSEIEWAEHKKILADETKYLEHRMKGSRRELDIRQIDLTSPIFSAMVSNLSKNEKHAFNAMIKLEKKFNRLSNSEWTIINKATGQIYKMIFEEVKQLYLVSTDDTYEIKDIFAKEPIPLRKCKEILDALKHDRNKASLSIKFTPDLSDPENLAAYELCEKSQWKLKISEEKEELVDFKTLHQAYLKNPGINYTCMPPNGKSAPSVDDIEKSLNVDWKIAPSSQFYRITENGPAPLYNLEVKPFVQMDLIGRVLGNPQLVKAINQRLTVDSKYKAILMGIIQCYDLHSQNIGLVPVPNLAFEHFSKTSFEINLSGTIVVNTLPELQKNYLAGNITDSTVLHYMENGQLVEKTVGEIEGLKAALETDWEFVFFDLDLAIGESRYLITNEGKHLIPIRSAILENADLRDSRLPNEIIEALQNPDWKTSVSNWMENSDSPIYRRMSLKTKKEVSEKLTPIIEQFSNLYQSGSKKSHKKLRQLFANAISDPHNPLWESEELSSLWQTIASDISKDRFNIDLISNNQKATDNRMKIASQLFPRLTTLEKKSFDERTAALNKYISYFKQLETTNAEGKDLSMGLERYMKLSFNPFSTIERNSVIKKIIEANNDTEILNGIKNAIYRKSYPTYFNVMKSMYPLLADLYQLNQSLGESILPTYKGNPERLAGQLIGDYRLPIEETCRLVKIKYPDPENSLNTLASEIEKKIANRSYPSFNYF